MKGIMAGDKKEEKEPVKVELEGGMVVEIQKFTTNDGLLIHYIDTGVKEGYGKREEVLLLVCVLLWFWGKD